MRLLTNLVGDTWQPEAIEKFGARAGATTGALYPACACVLRNAKAAGVVVDWQQIDPAYKKDSLDLSTSFRRRLARR